MRRSRFILIVVLTALAAVVGAIYLLETQPVLVALTGILVILGAGSIVWLPASSLYLAPRRNDEALSALGQPPEAMTAASPVGPTRAQVGGTGKVVAVASISTLPGPEVVRELVRAERFLSEAQFPNAVSRRNADSWLRFLRVSNPFLLSRPAGLQGQILDQARDEVSRESFRKVRSETRRFFEKNEMAWPVIRPQVPVQSHAESRPTSNHPKTVSGPAESAPTRRIVNLVRSTWTVEAGDHAEFHSPFPEGTLVIGFVREPSGQPFDFYIMNRRNYARFCERSDFRSIYAERDRVAIDFEKWLPIAGIWYFVVDTYRKQSKRQIYVELRASVPQTQ